jgi:prepilin signal peptidase PulO-like enzyme (type II secretory pathway)
MATTVARLTFGVPVIGWMLKDALFGYPEAKYYFLFNVVTLLGIAIYLYGYAALIIYALSMTVILFVSLVILTGSDLVEQARRNNAQPSIQPSRLSLRSKD